MERWQVLSALAATTVLAALLAPTLTPETDDTAPTAPPLASAAVPAAHAEPAKPTLSPEVADRGTVHLRAGLDRPVITDGDSERYLVFELNTDPFDGPREPVDISLVVDVSGSMGGQKIRDAQAAARALVDQLDERDRFSLVAFDGRATVDLPAGPVVDHQAIYGAIDGMYRGGGTDILAGLRAGMGQLVGSEHPGTRRVVLLSDGRDSSSLERLGQLAGSYRDRGVSVSALGLGLDFDQDKMMAIADAGGGRYHFVDKPDALHAMFQEELQRASAVSARSVQVAIEVADGVELLEVYGYDGYAGGVSSDGWSAFLGDVTSGQTRKVVARVRINTGASESEVARLTTRYIDPEGGDLQEQTLTVRSAWGDAAAVQASVDSGLSGHAARAVAGVAMKSSVRSWQGGDAETARQIAEDRIQELEALASAAGDAAVAAPLSKLRAQLATQQTTSTSSYEGRYFAAEEQLEALGYIE